MRIYNNFTEALGEIKRDLSEMGVQIRTRTMQDKVIEGDPDFYTKEIENYFYRVTNPQIKELSPIEPWIYHEWVERVQGIEGKPVNPGEAYKTRSDVWDEFLHDGRFAYTYAERFAEHYQVSNVIEALRRDPGSRQGYIAMWNSNDGNYLGSLRIPCSLGWHVMIRNNKLNLTYFMRSCDFFTHFQNDVFLSVCLQKYIATRLNKEIGIFSHFIGSFHVYEKDVKNVF